MTPLDPVDHHLDRAGYLADSRRSAARTSLRPTAWAAASAGMPTAAIDRRQPGAIMPFFLSISLIIHHTAEVHEQVADLLRQLRRLQDLQVSVEVRFITVSDNFFEQIGVDFDFQIQSDTVGKHSTFAVPNPADGPASRPPSATSTTTSTSTSTSTSTAPAVDRRHDRRRRRTTGGGGDDRRRGGATGGGAARRRSRRHGRRHGRRHDRRRQRAGRYLSQCLPRQSDPRPRPMATISRSSWAPKAADRTTSPRTSNPVHQHPGQPDRADQRVRVRVPPSASRSSATWRSTSSSRPPRATSGRTSSRPQGDHIQWCGRDDLQQHAPVLRLVAHPDRRPRIGGLHARRPPVPHRCDPHGHSGGLGRPPLCPNDADSVLQRRSTGFTTILGPGGRRRQRSGWRVGDRSTPRSSSPTPPPRSRRR